MNLRFLNIINTWLTTLADSILRIYQATLSPDKWLLSPWLAGTVCSHSPHCSQYARECLSHYGFITSLSMITERVLSCWPSSSMIYDPTKYRVVFASWAPIWKAFLEQLSQDSRFEVVGVMTMPDAASWRWMKMRENTIATYAKSLWIVEESIQKPHSLRLKSKKRSHEAIHATQRLQERNPDFLVVVAYGQILPKSILDIPIFGPINVHGSLLPKYRGASPLQSVFLAWESITGVTVMYMNEWVDTWDMIDTIKTPLPISWTVKDLIIWIETHTPKFLTDTLWEFAKWRLDRVPQDSSLVTHTSKIIKQDWYIALDELLWDVYSTYQAYALWPKIFFVYNEITVVVESLRIDEALYKAHNSTCRLSYDTMQLNPAILSCTVKPAGKKSMNRESFINGYTKT